MARSPSAPRPARASRAGRRAAPAPALALDGLNAGQRAAVTAGDGPLLVLAGAGSGKTRVITMRIAWLLARGVPARHVLAVTFTHRAAHEMRERVAALVGAGRAGEATIGTFHSFCARLLREHGAAIGVPARFAIRDAADQLAAARAALRELRVAEATLSPGALHARISLLKSRLVSAERARADAATRQELLVARAYAKYDEQLRRTRSVDFDDLLLLAVRLLRDARPVRDALAARYRHVLVDEYQDTNAPQHEILRLLAGGHRNLCVVGDDDQSIYAWRGADVQKILRFERDFRGAAVVRLETNYRSTEPILEAANRVIRRNSARHDKTLRSAIGAGEPVTYRRLDDESAEAESAVREIAALTGDGRARPSDFAILFRAAVQARPFEAALRARSIPYRLVGGMSFFDRKEVRDVLAYLRLAADPEDEVSLLRVIQCPPRGVGRATLDEALARATAAGIPVARAFREEGATAGLPPAAVAAMREFLATMEGLAARDPGRDLVAWMRRVLAEVRYRDEVERTYADAAAREERWLGVMELLNLAENHVKRAARPTLRGFLEALTLSAEAEEDPEKDGGRDVVTLMTLHAAKGLEFARVFLPGVEEGLLPHARAVEEGAVEEERRLMYVGITRAMRHLTVTCVRSRARRGRSTEAMPSRFLYEMRGEEPPGAWRAWDA